MDAHGPASAAPRLRPLSLTEMLDVAIGLCVANAGTLLRAVLVVIVPIQVVATVVMVSTGAADYDVFSSTLPDDRTAAETNQRSAGPPERS